MNEFDDNLEYLMAELRRIDLRLRLQVARQRRQNDSTFDDQFRGLFISEEEIDFLVSDKNTLLNGEYLEFNDLSEATAYREPEKEGVLRKQAILQNNTEIRLLNLANLFGLNQFEIDSLLVCLAPEMDTRYEKIFGYLHDDVTRRRPSVSLVLNCLLDGLDERVSARSSFQPTAPLIANRILRIEEESSARTPSLLLRNLKADDRVINYLLGIDEVDALLKDHIQAISSSIPLGHLVLPEQMRQFLAEYAASLNDKSNACLYIQGPIGIGKRTAVQVICNNCDLPVIMVNVRSLVTGSINPNTAVPLIVREAKLQKAAICWYGFDILFSEDNNVQTWLQQINRAIEDFALPVFATGELELRHEYAPGNKTVYRLKMEYPPYDVRRRLWNMYLNGDGSSMEEPEIEEIADKFLFTPGQIRNAAMTARNLSLNNMGDALSKSDVYEACRSMSNHRLSILARKVEPRYEWNDIVLPDDQRRQLREIADFVKYKHIVYTDWHFEEKIAVNSGLNVIFAGPSGTGKTMAAEIISNELGLDLYTIDLSTIVSKYIGETEKNLDRVFTEAKYSNAILFFDEADALFGKRSEVRDSHDRYANIEVAYLLQKMEEYDGIVILATNLKRNIDEAFARRMNYSVEFPQPETPDRLLIWQRIFPLEAPLADDVNLDFMARQFKITGGNIKNIALAGAFLAASDGRRIGMEHLIRATKREYQKVGKLWNESDFGPYFEMIKG
ncbi:MAG: ATP-binding protein [Dehalococcoidia bacterium]